MIRLHTLVIALLAFAYLIVFGWSEQCVTTVKYHFSAPLPVQVQQTTLGFLSNLGAEMHFVRAAVFLGTPPHLVVDEKDFSDNIAQNFEMVSQLYPEFIDTYYLAQSSLAHVSPELAGRVIEILDRGIAAYPNDLIFPFFKGFDHFYYRQEVGHAAKIFSELATRPDTPSWLGHLAAILSAKDGELSAGLISLQVMYATEEDEQIKVRYAADIESFENALRIQEATILYRQKYDHYPETLDQLVPVFFEKLPAVGNEFKLLWTPPKLRLVRP